MFEPEADVTANRGSKLFQIFGQSRLRTKYFVYKKGKKHIMSGISCRHSETIA
jgi:hypothetical protein